MTRRSGSPAYKENIKKLGLAGKIIRTEERDGNYYITIRIRRPIKPEHPKEKYYERPEYDNLGIWDSSMLRNILNDPEKDERIKQFAYNNLREMEEYEEQMKEYNIKKKMIREMGIREVEIYFKGEENED